MINFKKLKIEKKGFFLKLLKANINLQVHYIPLFKQPFLKKVTKTTKPFLFSKYFYSREVSLPIHFEFFKDEQLYVAKKILEILNLK